MVHRQVVAPQAGGDRIAMQPDAAERQPLAVAQQVVALVPEGQPILPCGQADHGPQVLAQRLALLRLLPEESPVMNARGHKHTRQSPCQAAHAPTL